MNNNYFFFLLFLFFLFFCTYRRRRLLLRLSYRSERRWRYSTVSEVYRVQGDGHHRRRGRPVTAGIGRSAGGRRVRRRPGRSGRAIHVRPPFDVILRRCLRHGFQSDGKKKKNTNKKIYVKTFLTMSFLRCPGGLGQPYPSEIYPGRRRDRSVTPDREAQRARSG